MNAMHLKYLLISLALFAAAAGGIVLRPTQHIASERPKVDLKSMIPSQFADWKTDDTIIPLQVNPQTLAAINHIYNQTLARTYVNPKGERIMLSIAYSGDQSDSMQVHKPEVCYPANGFQVLKSAAGMLDTGFGMIEVKRMLAARGDRLEPIVYWITIGDAVAVDSIEWKLIQLKYGLTGRVPDGLLFRVSSLGDEAAAYQVQEDFIRVLLKTLTPENRRRLIGSIT